MADYIQVPGKHNIYVAVPAAYSVLLKLGESFDETIIQLETIFHDVHGDRYGGPQGPPIEKQWLGLMGRAQLRLSRWDPAVTALLERFGGLLTTPGTVPEAAAGALMLRDRSFRFYFQATRDNSLSRNFPCCIASNLTLVAGGTKFAMYTFDLEIHKAPEGHAAAGVIYNADATGV